MKHAHYFTILIACCLALIFFALQSDWFVWRGPASKLHSAQIDVCSKPITLHYRQHGNEQQEDIELVWSSDDQKNLQYLLNTWLTFLFDEECIPHKMHVDTVILNPSKQEIFISFDRKPFSKEQAMHEKIGFIQDLCATLSCMSTIDRVRFLVHHQPLSDPHLDFAVSWLIPTTT